MAVYGTAPALGHDDGAAPSFWGAGNFVPNGHNGGPRRVQLRSRISKAAECVAGEVGGGCGCALGGEADNDDDSGGGKCWRYGAVASIASTWKLAESGEAAEGRAVHHDETHALG